MSGTPSSVTEKVEKTIRFRLVNLWKFSRPHTIIGTSLSVLALYSLAVALQPSVWSWGSLWQLAGAALACWCGNIYIVGLNQLEDVAIDRINKPDLPLASGAFSLRQGQIIVGVTGVLALLSAAFLGGWLLATVGFSLALGTAYSLPPVRLKRFPFLAALCIFTVRGGVVNLGLFLHYRNVLGLETGIPAVIWLLSAFIVVFTVAIAIFKDVPDTQGDKRYQITTFTILLGKPAILQITGGIITLCYGGLILAAVADLARLNPWVITLSHGGLLLAFWWQASRVNLEEQRAIARFYQFIWKLFFLEYLLFPIACWLAE
ncbi:homogentisate phytyltransferase [Spirulina sp. CS-785/01]|uniref:homogentisate phytyltransferase n=1 Tax=Spirulina sp. CS-785/01 TaxID=3021716 RepID=UPI0023305167|nr:homogentisate phytyltransferase [Spirulina sp. CS-785/01]MDB9311550.1 homogentisate phytyltransferase [Spirulina sp. CS-785/01]